MFRSALCSPFAPAFRFRECHSIRPCPAQSLSLTEAFLQATAQASSYESMEKRGSGRMGLFIKLEIRLPSFEHGAQVSV